MKHAIVRFGELSKEWRATCMACWGEGKHTGIPQGKNLA